MMMMINLVIGRAAINQRLIELNWSDEIASRRFSIVSISPFAD